MARYKSNIFIIIMMNIIFLTIGINFIRVDEDINSMKEGTKSWVEAENPRYTDLSIHYDGTDDDDSGSYKFVVERNLTYVYEGQEYTVKDTKIIRTSDKDMNYTLQSDYTEPNLKVRVKPENPKSYMVSMGTLSEDGTDYMAMIFKIIGILLVAAIAIVDIKLILSTRQKTEKIFEE